MHFNMKQRLKNTNTIERQKLKRLSKHAHFPRGHTHKEDQQKQPLIEQIQEAF